MSTESESGTGDGNTVDGKTGDGEADANGVIHSDGSDRVKGRQKDGATPARELWRVVVIGIPVIVIAWYLMKWLLRR